MANYYGKGRTNEFAVKDIDALKEALKGTEVEVVQRGEGNTVVLLLDDGDCSDFSLYLWGDEEGAEDEYMFVPDMIAEHLQPGQIAVFQHSGWEKLRYTDAWAIAVHSDGRQVRVSIHDVYDAAATEFGVDRSTISPARY